MKVLQIITSLSTGGAETMLRNVVLGLDRQHFQARVISLTGKDSIGKELEADGVSVTALDGRRGLLYPHQFMRARRVIQNWQPDLVHSWMYHANVFAHCLRASGAGARQPLITSVRGALNAPHSQGSTLRLVRCIDARLSKRADAVVYNSAESAKQHANSGYDRAKTIVIPNGFDTARFRPDAAARTRVRAELGINGEELIGLVARFNSVKGHRIFLEAAKEVHNERAHQMFVLIGRDCDTANAELVRWIAELGLGQRVKLLGERRDMPAVLNALDIAVCASISESFPNAIGEAMACGKPCVVTDVGDCAFLIGDAGEVAPAADPIGLAVAISRLSSRLAMEGQQLATKARKRVVSSFSLNAVVQQFAQLYVSVLQAHPMPRAPTSSST